MHKFNRADKTLLAAACFFVIALLIKVRYPGVIAKGFLFCVEAALVGGIADWFAVSALFKKPLGIPWHTAILTKRRQAFTEATIRLVQKQFFAKKIIFQRIKMLNAPEKIIQWLDSAEQKKIFAEKTAFVIFQKAAQLDIGITADKLALFLDSNMGVVLSIDKYCNKWLEGNEWKKLFIKNLASFAEEKFSDDAGLVYIEKALEQFENEKLKSGTSSFWLSLGGILDVINNEECAKLIQKKLLVLSEQLSDEQSRVYKDIMSVVDKSVKEMITEKAWKETIAVFQKKILDAGMTEKLVLAYMNDIKGQLSDPSRNTELKKSVTMLAAEEIEKCFAVIHNNKNMRELIDSLINDMLNRSALQAQSMVGDIVRRALNNMSDEQLNDIVHSKINVDLIWIRMNGSIVGGGIGFLLFVFMEVIK
ncbi:DUF445 family protein [Pectinatus haikarae]|uniref:Uncharacterized membrane-anchored protein YjiN (DUF445 family) n=1 Tax=Pectinatus haikarae TaxID=349096 RepID=A0ABT9Y3N2_9FIRM|nr:DUF445 family protein [Pectinatus haikarae]MDQ0202433.1 uncharacterized membrane-anchored protein YjiN (DUF445 family) [Pectinatus haikarae]